MPDASDAGVAEVYGLAPNVYDSFSLLDQQIWQSGAVDPALLELVRLRVARLVDAPGELVVRHPEAVAAGLTEDKIAALAQWPTSDLYDARDRAALAFAEIYVMDAQSVTDEMCAEMNAHFTEPELAAFTIALASFDAMARFRSALDV